jgi:hypothetical protein
VVRVAPAEATVTVAQTVTLAITVENVADLGSFQFTAEYDGSLLAFVEAQVGPFLGVSGRAVDALDPVVGVGEVTLAAFSSPPGPGASGSGVLATLTFHALKPGETPMRLRDVILVDTASPQPALIPAGTVGGTVAVVAGEGPTVYLPFALKPDPR